MFEAPYPLAMESADAYLCEEISVEKARELLHRMKGQPMDIEGVAVRVEVGDESQAPAQEASAATLISDDKLVRVFTRIRDAKKAFVAEHEKQLLETYDHPLAVIQTELKRRLQGREAKGLKTEHGTVYLAETLKVSIADGSAFIGWGKAHDCLEIFYEQRIKAGEVKNYMEQHNGEVPPGLNIFRETEARVRKPTQRGAKAVGEAES